MESRSWPRDPSSREGKRWVGRASAAPLKDPLFVRGTSRLAEGTGYGSLPPTICSQEWRPWGLEETVPSEQGRPPWSTLALGLDSPRPSWRAAPGRGWLWHLRISSLHHTHPTGCRGENETSSPLHRAQAEIRMLGPRPTNALNRVRVALKMPAARRLKASTQTPGSEPY